ncbi:MAG: kelch repeat-containing protein [bacterium]|nr:kelch repeat-containing protein [bacterium]
MKFEPTTATHKKHFFAYTSVTFSTALVSIVLLLALARFPTSVARAYLNTSLTIEWSTVAQQEVGTLEAQGTAHNGRFYFFGGYDRAKQPRWVPSRRAYVYDPAANTWTRIADMPKGATHAGTTSDGRHIYYAGGYVENATQTGQIFATTEVWRYDPVANTYSAMPPLPEARGSGALQYVNGELHFISGTNLNRQDRGEHWMLNIGTGATSWVVEPSLPNPRNHAGSAVLNGLIYYVGGNHGQDPNVTAQRDVHAYNPTNNTWTEVADLPAPRNHIAKTTVTVGNRIIVIAGDEHFNWVRRTVYAYDPGTNTWSRMTDLPTSQHSGVAAVIDNVMYYTTGAPNWSRLTYRGVIVDETPPTATPAPVPAAPVLVSPSATTITTRDPVQFQWNPVPNATTYTLYVGTWDGANTTQLYMQPVPNLNSVCSAGLCTYTPGDLPWLANGTYAWNVWAGNAQSNGVWGAGNVFTLAIPANIPAGLAVNGTMTTPPVMPTFQWSHDPYATQYEVWIGTADYATTAHSQWHAASTICSGEVCTLAPGVTFPNGEFIFHVRAANNVNLSEWSAGAGFTPAGAPAVPTNITATPNQGRPTISWSDDARADRFFVAIYNLMNNSWAYSAYHTKGQADLICNGTTCTLNSDAIILGNDQYSVYVNAEGPGGVSAGGPFNNGFNGPVTFTLNFPAPALVSSVNASSASGSVNITFTSVSGVTWYYLWIGTANGTQTFYFQWHSSNALNCASPNTTCTISLPLNLVAGTYYAAVQSAGPGGYSVGGPVGNGFQVSAGFNVP